ncbi:hypothetical protein M3667_06900 [Microbacterium sp. P26]|uniref:hypothetical protein n=1 Tax=Microbacterium TaxID=33882 RepID=UPI002040C269|nr:hypothetical protein [Microbacterium sp. P26]MCM3501606.1 hypothetical protein [Microbacterium sp. P26]
MSAVAVAPEADSAASVLAAAGWQSQLPAPGAGGDDCGSGLSGFASVIARFVAPLEDLLEEVTGDPAGLYHASHTWEVYAGDVQQVSQLYSDALRQIQGHVQGLTATVVEGSLALFAAGTHSIADWSKVVSQALQLCVRAVEIMRSLVCSGFELLSSAAGVIGDVLFGSWPWELDEKAQAISDFADNCAVVIDEVVANIDRVLQALRELVRLLTDLYRAIVPFHQNLENLIGQLLETFPPGSIPGVGGLPGLAPNDGTFGDIDNPGPEPYPGSDQRFRQDYPLGYQHEYDLGTTDMTTAELNQMLRDQFGHVFLPSREGDNSQLNMQLTGEGQTIKTSLFGMGIPGVTAGDIQVQQITDDGFVIAAQPGHPEYPGEVAFRLRNVDGRAVFEVTGAYDETILSGLGFGGDTNGAYAGISDVSIWADMQYRLEDMINYGPS